MTHTFVETAHAMARMCGMPDYPFAVIPHPIANNGGDQLRSKAEDAVRQCVAILVEGQAEPPSRSLRAGLSARERGERRLEQRR